MVGCAGFASRFFAFSVWGVLGRVWLVLAQIF